MHKFYLLLGCIFWIGSAEVSAQRLEKFSEDQGEFLTQLHGFMTASKQKTMEDTFKDFEKVFKSGIFNSEESEQVLRTGNAMLSQRMSANPYFTEYLTALLVVKKMADGGFLFKEWHKVLDAMLADIENRNLTRFQDFIRFSINFFDTHALRFSDVGTSWYALADQYDLQYYEGQPMVVFDKLNLVASRKKDSILIHNTSGAFYPVEGIWRGKGGKVTWERFNLDPNVYVELGEYEFDAKQSLYEVQSAKLHYPTFFGNRIIEGWFSDKLVASSDVTVGSYPRFESRQGVQRVDNIGEGIEFVGGFKIHGTTIYGFGNKNEMASLKIFNDDKLIFQGKSQLFTIKREERIVGEGVEAVMYFGKDSIYHPSVNIRFEIPKRELQLSRGQRGSDRNPFFNSYHNVNIHADQINAYLNSDSIIIGERTISIARKDDVSFESFKFFRKTDYQRIQNIATANPIAIMKATAEREGTNFINANLLAQRINSKFTVDNIQTLLYDLVAQGFINYHSDEQLVELKDKVFHYVNADQDRVDYDMLKINSRTDDANAVLNLRDNSVAINGVNSIEFSRRQRVAAQPVEGQIVMKENRNLDFDGKIFAGFSAMEGKDFHFDYDKFHIGLDSVRFFDLFVPTGELDKEQNPIAMSIGSRIEHLNGVLLIDAPSNKSGREDIQMFPSLQSKDNSFVFYDYKETLNGAYNRDSFYFELNPFSFNRLDGFTAKDIRFQGKLVSADIFPEIQETLILQEEDQSLGFITKTPKGGYPGYTGKGNYDGVISLSNKGLLGQGHLTYLGARINSEDVIFKPSQLLASAERFDLEENRKENEAVPQVRGVDVKIDWRPYKDSMYIRSAEAPFQLYKQNNHTLKGTLILTPGGLKGDGLLDWDKAHMDSRLFSFGAFSAKADTTEIGIKAFDAEELALRTSNVSGFVDFDRQVGTFKANDEFLVTTLPYNQYITSMNEFNWDMKEETIVFTADKDKPGTFISIHPDQDSLRFQGTSAFYNLKNSQLKIGGVPHIVAADAFVYPESGDIEIQPGGVMTTLENARIVADTVNQYHVINRATVDIMGRKYYKASGFYEYNIGDRQQEIELQNIVGQRVGKGDWSEKNVATRATGTVTPEDSFYIDHKTVFQGTIHLNAESKNLRFEGFALLEAEKLPQKYWFTISSEGDKKNLAISYDEPKSFEGEPLATGLFLSRETARLYPRVMMPLHFRKDRPILPAKGVFKYDDKKDFFIFGDSSKVIRNERRGNQVVFKNRDGNLEAEGKFNIGSGLKYISVDAAGIAKSAFPPPPPPQPEGNIMLPDENIMPADDPAPAPPPAPDIPVIAEMMAGIKLIFPERLMKVIATDIKSAGFDARPIVYLTELDFYQKAASELFPDVKESNEVIDAISTGYLDMPDKFNNYTFLFSKLKMKWDPDYQSFVSIDDKIGLVSINGESVNKVLTCYVQFQMPTNDDDRVYVYIKSPSELFYYFGYKQGILSVASNNTKFMDEVLAMKSKEAILKMDDGETYEIQAVGPEQATLFVRRAQAVK